MHQTLNLYFDNAATSYPKPEEVYQAADNFLRCIGGNPGRGSHHRSLDAYRIAYTLREKLVTLFNAPDPSRIILTFNATDALNIAIKGFVKQGDHVLYTAMEHNSVLRPVGRLTRNNFITATKIPCSEEGFADLQFLAKNIRPETRLLIINHASNVCGAIQPLREMIAIAKAKGVVVLVDAAQTAGTVPVDVEKLDIDMLAWCGHKGLLGPQGTGGLYVREGLNLQHFREGGTGSFSDQDIHPGIMPERLEAGTMNGSGLAGLLAGVEYILQTGLTAIREQEMSQRSFLYEQLSSIPGVRVYGNADRERNVAVISLTISGKDCGEVGYQLEDRYNILCRTGLHCAPLAHQALQTFPTGTVRISPGLFNTRQDLEYLITAINSIALS